MLAGQKLSKMKPKSCTERCIYRKQRNKPQSINTTHLILFIVIPIILINILNHLTERKETFAMQISLSNTKIQSKHLENMFIFSKLKKNSIPMKTNKPYKTFILLIILLSNDIHQNPGPKQQAIKETDNLCRMCNQKTENEDSMKCDTCNKWSHIACTGNIRNHNRSSLNKSFEWICSNTNCSPNHVDHTVEHQLTSPNRYQQIEKEVTLKQRETSAPSNSSKAKRRRPKAGTKSSQIQAENESLLMLQELTTITTTDYVGKDLCRKCTKEVKIHHQAISCDKCLMWIHRSCSDMSSYLYKQSKKKGHFKWICKMCREDEKEINDRVDVTTLKPCEMPLTANSIQVTSREMLIIHLNCRSILNKVEELEMIVEECNPDIIVLTETWMDDSVPKQACIPDGYHIIRKDRSTNFKQKYGKNKGGGVAILYKQHIKVEKKKNLTDSIEEILWVHVKIKQSFMLGAIYRAEYTDTLNEDDAESKIEENIRKASEITNNVIITGDFNIDMTDGMSKNTQLLTNIYESYGLKQHINKPTRVDKTSRKPTIIDHMWARKELNIIKATGTFHGISDHMGIYMKLNKTTPTPEKEIIKYRDYR